MSCELKWFHTKEQRGQRSKEKLSVWGSLSIKLCVLFSALRLCMKFLQAFYQLQVCVPVNRFHQIITNPLIRARFLHIIPVNRRAYYVQSNGFGEPGIEFLVFFQELPAIHHRHIDIEENNVGKCFRVYVLGILEIGNSFAAIVKRLYLFSQAR